MWKTCRHFGPPGLEMPTFRLPFLQVYVGIFCQSGTSQNLVSSILPTALFEEINLILNLLIFLLTS